MAQLIVPGVFTVDYSMIDGDVRWFVHRDEMLFSKRMGIAVDGWERLLADLAREYRRNRDDGWGVSAFVYWLEDKGLIEVIG